MSPVPPPRPRLQTHREPSAPDLAGLFPSHAGAEELARASRAQAAFLWHYSEQLDRRLVSLEQASERAEQAAERREQAQRDEAERNEKFRAELAEKELARERRDAERRSVTFWFAWLLPVATGLLGALGSRALDSLFH